jgi:probable F420-dependent oxidoreductase
MHLGIFSYNVDYGARPDELARACEEHGFESFWLGEHTHIPACRRTPYPGGGELPKPYYHMADPFVSLMAAAAVTRTIKLGTGVCLVVEHDPIVLAKTVATLDWLSNGRFVFGIGGGWNREEMENHGTMFSRRWQVLRERVLAMKAIWTQEEAEYHGRHVDFDPIWSWPKPQQRPHPPILVGGNGPKVLDRVLAFGDEWMPNRMDGFAERVRELQRRANDAGRDEIPVTFSGAKPDAETVEQIREAGAERITFYVKPENAGEVERRLDRYADLAPSA